MASQNGFNTLAGLRQVMQPTQLNPQYSLLNWGEKRQAVADEYARRTAVTDQLMRTPLQLSCVAKSGEPEPTTFEERYPDEVYYPFIVSQDDYATKTGKILGYNREVNKFILVDRKIGGGSEFEDACLVENDPAEVCRLASHDKFYTCAGLPAPPPQPRRIRRPPNRNDPRLVAELKAGLSSGTSNVLPAVLTDLIASHSSICSRLTDNGKKCGNTDLKNLVDPDTSNSPNDTVDCSQSCKDENCDGWISSIVGHLPRKTMKLTVIPPTPQPSSSSSSWGSGGLRSPWGSSSNFSTPSVPSAPSALSASPWGIGSSSSSSSTLGAPATPNALWGGGGSSIFTTPSASSASPWGSSSSSTPNTFSVSSFGFRFGSSAPRLIFPGQLVNAELRKILCWTIKVIHDNSYNPKTNPSLEFSTFLAGPLSADGRIWYQINDKNDYSNLSRGITTDEMTKQICDFFHAGSRFDTFLQLDMSAVTEPDAKLQVVAPISTENGKLLFLDEKDGPMLNFFLSSAAKNSSSWSEDYTANSFESEYLRDTIPPGSEDAARAGYNRFRSIVNYQRIELEPWRLD